MNDTQAIAAIRDAYVMAGSPNGIACNSKTCLNIATRRVFWPVLRDEIYPVYCERCAAKARQVLEVLGIRYSDEALPVTQIGGKTRQINTSIEAM